MEQTLVHLAHAAIWFFVIVFCLAIVGVVAIIGWIVALFRKGAREVETGVQRVEDFSQRR